MTTKNRVHKIVDKFLPIFEDSIPKMSEAMGVHRSTLHHAMKRGTFSTDLQSGFMKLSEKHEVKINFTDLLNA
ncbi:MAG: hypothetical protein JKY93_12325 [Gammaproteobacteria bacterium]|nr:hypothetical protein [Gammaproteobacteria bacterium]